MFKVLVRKIFNILNLLISFCKMKHKGTVKKVFSHNFLEKSSLILKSSKLSNLYPYNLSYLF